MHPHKDQLTPAEWIVMNALWERSPMTLSETIAQIGTRAAWNYKTFAAYLAILEKRVSFMRKSADGTSCTVRLYPKRNALRAKAAA